MRAWLRSKSVQGRVQEALIAIIYGLILLLTIFGHGIRTCILGPFRLLALLYRLKIILIPLPKARIFIPVLALSFAVLAPFSIGIAALARDLPHPSRLTREDRDLATELYDRNGTLLYRFYAEKNRTLVELNDLPEHLIQATIAIEDRNFYKHHGVDLRGIIRALHVNLTTGTLSGGSTITQQLIKNTLLSPEKTVQRKLREVVLALWTEVIYSKEEILKMYVNEVAYGGPAWGVRSATLLYFDKEPHDLTLGEAGIIAGLPAAPSLYSPFGPDPDVVRARQKEVLRRMVEDGYISREQADTALSETITFAKPTTAIKAPHFVMYVRDELIKTYGERRVYTGGLRVTTTLDLALQAKIEEIVRTEVEKLKYLSVSNGAALVTDPKTGEILALIGSLDYFGDGGNFNVATARRQPGSAIKPVTYAAAFQAGYVPSTIILDMPVSFAIPGQPAYRPVNYDDRWHGPISLRNALGNSYNIPAVKLVATIGVPKMIELARDMGITSFDEEDRYGLSITLGGAEITMLDMMNVYGVLANGGIRNDPTPILSIEDAHGHPVVYEVQKGTRVLEPEIAFLLTDILSDNKARSQAFGSNSPLRIDRHQVAVKTGTSDKKRDNWTFGYTPSHVVGVWVGNNNNKPMHPLLTSGITGAAPIWQKIMLHLLSGKEPQYFARPENVVERIVRGNKDLFVRGKPVKELVKIEKEQFVIRETGEIISEFIHYTDMFSTYATPSVTALPDIQLAQDR